MTDLKKGTVDELYWIEEDAWQWYVGISIQTGFVTKICSIYSDPVNARFQEINTSCGKRVLVDEELLMERDQERGVENEEHITNGMQMQRWRPKTDLLLQAVLNELAGGKTLLEICNEKRMIPPVVVFHRWALSDPAFKEAMKIAERIRAGVYHDKAMEGGELDPDMAKEIRSRFTWGAEVGNPKKYNTAMNDSLKALAAANAGAPRMVIISGVPDKADVIAHQKKIVEEEEGVVVDGNVDSISE